MDPFLISVKTLEPVSLKGVNVRSNSRGYDGGLKAIMMVLEMRMKGKVQCSKYLFKSHIQRRRHKLKTVQIPATTPPPPHWQ